MRQVGILAIEGATSFSVLGCKDMLTKVNEVAGYSHFSSFKKYFEPKLVGVEDKVVKSSSGHPFICDHSIDETKRYDLILIPSCDGDILQTVRKHTTLTPWLQRQHAEGATLGSMCTGAFLLAATGLLDGKYATTHWAYFNLFRQKYPMVKIETAKNIVDYGTLICAGGGTSFIHLTMYLIEKYYGHEFAALCSKFMLVDMEKTPQTAYSIFTPQKQHGDHKILEAQNFIETNFHTKLKLETIASKVALTSRTLMRRFKKNTGNTPTEYLQKVRVEAARKLLENQKETLNSIMCRVGYNDMASFRKAFKKITGLNFSEYRKRFNKLVPY